MPLPAPVSPRVIFAHERNALRRFVDQDTFEELRTVLLQKQTNEVGKGNGGGEHDGIRGNDGKQRMTVWWR